MRLLLHIFLGVFILSIQTGFGQTNKTLKIKAGDIINEIETEIITWRHHLHQYPELSNREYKTSEFIAGKLREFGLEVKTGIAHTGVVGILKGGKPGPVIALRADMDALPVTERVEIPWKSLEKAEYNGQVTGVMHACGHDIHMAVLLGTANVLSGMKQDLGGTIKFIFQPAEEGAPAGEEGGAELMVREGVLNDPDAEAIFGLHVNSQLKTGMISYKPGEIMAAVNSFRIIVHGKQTHGSTPWTGIDPVVTSAQIINALQTVVSRQSDLTTGPAVVSVGAIHGGIRSNIIPEQVEMIGTIRTLDKAMREKILEDVRRTVIKVAESQGATAEITIDKGYPVTYNDPDLTGRMLSSLQEAVGKENTIIRKPMTGAEDFAYYQQKIPGMFFFLGGMPEGAKQENAPPHHTPSFYVDDSCIKNGIKAFCYLVLDYEMKFR
ncbi:MAG TPA: amidohydrolase [Cyclobacteriaceae bacterium]|nr:amidohydrolase [Cyclobacteriaceae bacterium]